jgi:hypothetical protein
MLPGAGDERLVLPDAGVAHRWCHSTLVMPEADDRGPAQRHIVRTCAML